MSRNVVSSRTFLRIALALAAMVVASSIATIASADPPKRKGEPSRRALVAGGTGAFLLGYGYAAGMGELEYRTPDGHVPSDMLVPIAGPYMALAQNQITIRTLASTKLVDGYFRDRSGATTVGDVAAFEGGLVLFAFEYAALLADPIAQGGGLATAALGDLSSSEPSRAATTPHVTVGPAWNAGPGVSLSVTSW